MAKENATKTKLLITSVAIDNLTSVKFSVNNKLIDVTNKDSAGWEENIDGMKSASFTVDGIIDFQDSGYTPDEIFTALVVGAALALEITNAVTSDKKYTFSGRLEKLDYDFPTEDKATFSLSGKATGVVTQATI